MQLIQVPSKLPHLRAGLDVQEAQGLNHPKGLVADGHGCGSALTQLGLD